MNSRVVIGIALAVLAFGALTIYSSNQAKVASVWEGIATANKKQAVQEAERATEAEKSRDEALAIADERGRRNSIISSRLADAIAKIPAPQAVPVLDPELIRGLEAGGMTPGLLVIRKDGPSILTRADAEKAWVWNQQGAMVPSLQASLALSQEVSAGLGEEVKALRLSNTFATEAGDAWHQAHDRQKDRGDALDKSVQALTKKQKADWWVKWGTVAGGIAAGYLAGRAVR